jgi:hypothetical protein
MQHVCLHHTELQAASQTQAESMAAGLHIPTYDRSDTAHRHRLEIDEKDFFYLSGKANNAS